MARSKPKAGVAQDLPADNLAEMAIPAVAGEDAILFAGGALAADCDEPVPVEVPDLDEPALDLTLPSIDDRERALPVRQGDLTRLLLAEPGVTDEDRGRLTKLGHILGAIFHSECYSTLSSLKELYAPLDPDSDYVNLGEHTTALTEDADERFLAPFEQMLLRANYRGLDIKVIEEAVSAPNETGLTYVPDFSLFEHLKVYVRGYTEIVRDCRSTRTRFRKKRVRLDAYQRMVVALKFKPGRNIGPFVRSDAFYLRMFKDVPHVDMEMHLPEQGARVRMRWQDKAQIASPLLMGLPALVAKWLALTALSPFALGGLLLAPVSAGVSSFFGFQRAKQKHLSAMIQRLYYLTLANNASVLTRLIDSAEEEEYKEAMTAYFFGWRGVPGGGFWTVSTLDAHIEAYLFEKTGVRMNFDVSDALGKLLRLGIAARDSVGQIHVAPPERALQILDKLWDDTFQFR